jgi:O-antigen ligase
VTPPPAASTTNTLQPRERWLRHARMALLLVFWLSILFFPEHPAAHPVFGTLALGTAALTVLLLVGDMARSRAGMRAMSARDPVVGDAGGPAASPWRAAAVFLAAVWPYVAYLLMLTIAWRAHPDGASGQEYVRQLCFLATVLAVAQGARGMALRWIAVMVVGLALIVVQILGPHSVLDALGRPLHYRSIQQWSGYPEIGLLASLGSVASLALVLADRRWRVRLAGAFFAGGFALATVYLLSRFSLVTIVIAGAWLALVSVVRLRGRLALTTLGVCVIVATGLVLVRADFSARLQSVLVDRTLAVEIRSEGWRVASAMLHDHPLAGVGPGRYREEYPNYSSTGDRGHAYNIVLHEGAELGYLGLAAYLALWARVLWRSLRASGRSAAGVAALAAHGMLVAFFVRSQSEHFLANLDASFRLLLLLAFVFGLAESVASAPRSAARVAAALPRQDDEERVRSPRQR